ncbi:MAG: hypothetical protein MUF14_02920 [Hyphomonadaceae bacterium]|jgi:hypothetical protein|nr:hypothetical protein [Hyphomonadaceae bacterium]
MRLEFLPPHTLTAIAWALRDTHGNNALAVADRTIGELVDDGEDIVADAWRCLRSVLEDVMNNRLARHHTTVH